VALGVPRSNQVTGQRPSTGVNSIFRKCLLAFPLLLTASACTPVLDQTATQCRVDSDCDRFGRHPHCTQEGICKSSGFQENCFLATPSNPPTTREQFLNQCTINYTTSTIADLFESPAKVAEPQLIDPPTLVPPMPSNMPPPVPTVNCRDMAPPGGSVLFMSGSSNFKPLLTKLAPYIVAEKNLTPVFKVTTSCSGVRSMDPRYPADHIIRDPLPGSTDTYAQYYIGDDPVNCLLGPNGAVVDVGESEIFPETCGVTKNTVDVAENLGPILPIVLVVPQGSHSRAISAETARQVFGGGGSPPWTENGRIYIRGGGTATLRLVGLAIGVAPTKFWGVDQGSAEAMSNNLPIATPPDQAIGMIGTDLYDANRLPLRTLGFRASGQDCAYWPDSTLTSKDKINVRDGHYPLWGRLHFFTGLVGGIRVSDAATKFVSLFSSAVVPRPMLDAFIDSSFIPDCAMKIRQDDELGLPVSEAPALSCSCYFDAHLSEAELPSSCTACETSDNCEDPKKPLCNYGYCDALR
jgi:hypothetical protein